MKTYKIAITTGDTKGIGKEITKKALDFLNPVPDEALIIGKKVADVYDTVELDDSITGEFCYNSLKKAAELAKSGNIGAIVTAPVSKSALLEAGYNFSGQTEVLKKFFNK